MKNLIQYSCSNSVKGRGQTVHYCRCNISAFSHDCFCSCSIRLKLTICYTKNVVQFDPSLTENFSFKFLNFLALIKGSLQKCIQRKLDIAGNCIIT